MVPVIKEIKDKLKEVPPAELAKRSGADLESKDGDSEEAQLKVDFFNQTYSISYPQFKITNPDGEECKEEQQALLLNYLKEADGTPISGQWISFSELPNGDFYHRAFKSYSANRLPKFFKSQPDELAKACESLNGTSLSFGDQSFSFQILPRIKLAVVYWPGGDEFPDRAHILFDKSANHYLSTDGLAQLGRILTDMLIKTKKDMNNDEDSDNR